MLDFPNAPTVGQKYPQPAVTGSPVYKWDGVKWSTVGAAAVGKAALLTDGSAPMAAGLTVVAPPVNPTDASAKSYADSQITAAKLYADAKAYSYSPLNINGSMRINQELGGIPQTASGRYAIDGYKVTFNNPVTLSSVQSTDAPPGFAYSLAVSVTAADPGYTTYCTISHRMEGSQIACLNWGTANAQPLTISFWCKVHRPGLYSGYLYGSTPGRNYIFTWTQNAADTWEYKTVTIPGDTASATWLPSSLNLAALEVDFTISCTASAQGAPGVWTGTFRLGATGTTNGAAATTDVFKITGVTMFPGLNGPPAASSPLVMRQYVPELLLCSRYFQWNRFREPGYCLDASEMVFTHAPLVPYRVNPTLSLAATAFYMECPAWAVGVNMTGANVYGDHMYAQGGDYKLFGVLSPVPTTGMWAVIGADAVIKFDARL